jgi:hypothetical protein
MDIIAERQQQVLYDKKWHLFMRQVWIFRHLPFVRFVIGSGSMAIGNVDEESDFDVLIGVAPGRIFTARFCAVLFTALAGKRRGKEHGHSDAANKICLNHFVTPAAYKLRLPAQSYWRMMYERMVPVYGEARELQAFFDANTSWLGTQRIASKDLRYHDYNPSLLNRALTVLLSGSLGNWVEEQLRQYQVRRIERGLPLRATTPHTISVAGEKTERIELAPLITYTDEELEFHPAPAVVEIRGGER